MFWLRYSKFYFFFFKVSSNIARVLLSQQQKFKRRVFDFVLSRLFSIQVNQLFLSVVLLLKNLLFFFRNNFFRRYYLLSSWRVKLINHLRRTKGLVTDDFRLRFPWRMRGKRFKSLSLSIFNRRFLLKRGRSMLLRRLAFFKSGRRYFLRRRKRQRSFNFVCTIRSVKNNIFFTFYSRTTGATLVALSAGLMKFRGKKKKTPFAANKTACMFAKRVKAFMNKLPRRRRKRPQLCIRSWGISSGVFKQAFYGFKEGGLRFGSISDEYVYPHALPVRQKKPRRV